MVTSVVTPDSVATSEGPSLDGLSQADRRRLRWGWAAGAVPSFVLFLWMLTAGRANFGRRRFLSGLFDSQARAFFDGHLDVPAEEAWFEGFLVGDKTYTYFGPLPAIVRMPVLAVTDAFDGRLTALSMLVALVILVVASFRLLCTLRATVRGDVPVTRREVQLTAVVAVAVLVAPPFFLASATIVYHEPTLWGLALTVAAFNSVARWQRDPTRRQLVIVVVVIGLAMLSRQSIAFGALVALGLAGLVLLVRAYREEDGTDSVARLRRLAPTAGTLLLAGLLAAGPSVVVQYAKFGELNIPIEKQRHSLHDTHRQEVLKENPRLMGPEYLPTTAWTYLRPDGIRFRGDFPWIDYPSEGPTVLYPRPTFDTLDWTSSLPATAPALTVLSLGAVVWAAVRRRRRGSLGPPLFPLIVGASASGLGVLILAYISNRYLADVYPLVLIGGLVGFHALVGTLANGGPDEGASSQRRLSWRRIALGAFGAVVAFGVLTNVALALSYQRERGHDIQEDWHAEYVRWRLALPGHTRVVQVGGEEADDLPEPADGTVLVVGDCESVYISLSDRDPARDSGATKLELVEEAPDDAVCRAALD